MRLPALAFLSYTYMIANGQFADPRLIVRNDLFEPHEPVLVDLNGDEHLDVLVRTSNGPYQLAWYAGQGDGSFSEIAMLPSGPQVVLHACADIDGDGDVDVIAIHQEYVWQGADMWRAELHFYANDGTGVFTAPEVLWSLGPEFQVSVYQLMTFPQQDGSSEIVVLRWASENTHTMIHRLTRTGPNAVTQHTQDIGDIDNICPADVDGDGDDDLLANTFQTSELLLFANEGWGDFDLQGAIWSDNGFNPGTLVADLDNDGDQDVIGLDVDRARTFLNDGSGDLVGSSIAWEDFATGGRGTADFNGDGFQDLYFYRLSTLNWMPGNGDGTFAEYALEFENVETVGMNGIATGDIDEDGDTDALLAWGYTSDHIQVLLNDGTGHWTSGGTIGQEAEGAFWMEHGDIDGDSDPDLMIGHQDRVVWYENLGTDSLPDHVIDALGGPGVLTDMDGDGDLDLFVGIHADQLGLTGNYAQYMNDGAGNFTSEGGALLPQYSNDANGLWKGDLDSDGREDLLALSDYNLYWFQRMPDGALAAPVVIIADDIFGILDLAVADIDGDLDQDLVFASTSEVLAFFNTGNETFPAPVSLFPNQNASAVVVADLYGTGPIDIAFMTTPGIFTSHWTGSAFSTPQLVVPSALNLANIQLEARDVDGDGDTDLIGDGQICFMNDGTGAFPVRSYVPIDPLNVAPMDFVDLDGDGRDEFISASLNSEVHQYHNYFLNAEHIEGTSYVDFDEDGVRDLDEPGMASGGIGIDPPLVPALYGADGDYRINAEPGTFTVSATPPADGLWEASGPSSRSVTLTGADPVAVGQDFGFRPLNDSTLVLTNLTGSYNDPANMLVWVDLSNRGTNRPSGVLALSGNILFEVASIQPPADSIVAGTVYWSFGPLAYYGGAHFSAVLDLTNAGALDTFELAAEATVTDESRDVDATFTDAWSVDLNASLGETELVVHPDGTGELGIVPLDTEHLEYTVLFRNTSPDTITSVIIQDSFDLPYLDPTTYLLSGSSHPVQPLLAASDPMPRFFLADLVMPPYATDPVTGQGYLSFTIRPGQPVQNGYTITNQAAITLFGPEITANATDAEFTTFLACVDTAFQIVGDGSGSLFAPEGFAEYRWALDGDTVAVNNWYDFWAETPGMYTVTVVDAFGCLSTSEPFLFAPLGLDQAPGTTELRLQPNPAQEATLLQFAGPVDSGTTVELLDLSGRMLFTTVVDGRSAVRLQRNGLAAGLYAVRIMHQGEVQGTVRLAFD